MPAEKPAFLVTVDVEGDDLWARPRRPTTRNARSLPRFHELCAERGLRPTYLTDYEMAHDGAFREFADSVLRQDEGEIGMHLHAWTTPPLSNLTADDARHQPYLTDYPEDVMRAKVRTLTDLLGEAFGQAPRSHRGGRWAFDETYAAILIEQGYRVDSSVTPGLSWRRMPGAPRGRGGPDYRRFPARAYFVADDDVGRPGGTELLEVPLTTEPAAGPLRSALRGVAMAVLPVGTFPPLYGAVNRLLPAVRWFRPDGRQDERLVEMQRRALREGRGFVNLMLHSSELMPGGSPTFPDERSIEALYEALQALFAAAEGTMTGLTLSEYRERFVTTEEIE